MGGKKKTKWRKLPLEEFTKEIPQKSEDQPPANNCRTEVTREENAFIPAYNGPSETIQNYTEPYEYIDGIWYPTSCVVYNPGLYSNYVMPADTCYYYCTMPDASQMQECMPLPYQEYTPALLKDTVYLLLPTQTFQPTQPVQNISSEWPNRRFRRRYEGYAEYAVIPEKTSSSKVEEKHQHQSRALGTQLNSKRKSAQFNNLGRMSSFIETSSSDGLVMNQNQSLKKSNETNKYPTNIDNEKGPSYANKEIGSLNSENNLMSKKNPEICGVHSRRKITPKVQQTKNGKRRILPNNDELYKFDTDIEDEEELIQESYRNISKSTDSNQPDNKLIFQTTLENTKHKDTQNENFYAMDDTSLTRNEASEYVKSITDQEKGINEKVKSLNINDECLQEITEKDETRAEEVLKTEPQASLPDILSYLNKTTNGKKQGYNTFNENNTGSAVLVKESPKHLSSQTSNTQSVFSSDAMHNEMEVELRELESLKASHANQSIYKLAYDENVTDQSGNSMSPSRSISRSPSPVTPESQIPCSYTRNEIIVHEAASDDDAGSEDVELIPHRYESESYLNQMQNKNVYVNKLSLAVELLRTQENLPYDGEFKRIVGENNVEANVHTGGKKNSRDSCSSEKSNLTNNTGKKRSFFFRNRNEITSQYHVNSSRESSSNSETIDININSFENEIGESVNDGTCPGNENQENAEETGVRYRRFGIQAHRHFSPLPFNPCFCCIIM